MSFKEIINDSNAKIDDIVGATVNIFYSKGGAIPFNEDVVIVSDTNNFKIPSLTDVVTITDFEAGTSSTAVDMINLKATLTTTTSQGATVFQKGVGTTATAGAFAAVQFVTFVGEAVTLTNPGNILLSITNTYDSAKALQDAVRANHFITSGAGNYYSATGALPALYINSSDGFVHLAAIQVGTAESPISSAELVDDIIIFNGITSLANFDASDFLYY